MKLIAHIKLTRLHSQNLYVTYLIVAFLIKQNYYKKKIQTLIRTTMTFLSFHHFKKRIYVISAQQIDNKSMGYNWIQLYRLFR